jgi:hypothetical protein
VVGEGLEDILEVGVVEMVSITPTAGIIGDVVFDIWGSGERYYWCLIIEMVIYWNHVRDWAGS